MKDRTVRTSRTRRRPPPAPAPPPAEVDQDAVATLETAEAPAAAGPAGDAQDAQPTVLAAAPPAELLNQLTRAWTGVVGADLGPGATMRSAAATVGTAVLPSGRAPALRRLAAADPARPPAADLDYLLGPVIGSGGMGVVRRARQTALGREIALKQLRGGSAAAVEVRNRFVAEATATAALDHPGIVAVHDLGVDGNGAPFYAMKLVQGRPWSQVIDQLSRLENLDILLKLADAVAFAHSKGVIHRDLKPDNVMLGEFGEVLLLDWGLAAAVSPGAPAPALDADGPIAGTPAYMAPEMALGEIGRIGTWSDIYLLGGILLRLASGHPPHRGNGTREVVLAAAQNRVDAPAGGGELVDIALHALATDPAQRHATVQEFQADLRRYREHHESIALGRAAGDDLARAEAGGSYDDYAQAVSSFREALRLWEGNAVAQAGLDAARLAYARQAAGRGDFELAESLLDPFHQDHQGLLAEVRARRQRRGARLRRNRHLHWAAAGLGGALLASLAAGAWLTLRQERLTHEAEAARDHESLRALKAEVAARSAEAAQAERTRRRTAAFTPYAQAMDRLRRGEAQYEAAAEGFRAAIALDEDFAEAHFALGEALRLGGRPHLALPSYEAAGRLSRADGGKGDRHALLMAAFACMDAFEFPRADRYLAQVEAAGGDDPLALVARAFQFAYRGRYAQARSAAEEALKRDATLWETHCALGTLLLIASADGVFDPRTTLPQAVAALRRAYALAPTQPVVHIALARTLGRSGEAADRAQLQSLAGGEGMRVHPVLLVERALASLIAGRVEEAAALLAKAEAGGCPPGALRFGKAALARANGDAEAAWQELDALLKDLGDWTPLLDRWVRLGCTLPAHREAVAARFARWQGLNATQPARYVMAAALALANDDPGTADREIRGGLELAPYNLELIQLRCELLRKGKKWDELLAAVRSGLQLQPRDLPLRLLEVEALAGSGALPKAMAAFAALEKDFSERAAELARLRQRLR
ncbi:MAG: serine/threonine-protein kinase [Planctomycetes bacterium]|nr:serine/threonine-protein kinase [Planctomycetota bacterium]